VLPRILIIIFLVTLSAFFSASETALTGANRIRLKHKAEQGSAAAKKALLLLKKYDRMLATLLIGNNTVNLVAASIATVFAIFISTPENEAFMVALVTGIITVILIIIGDILPKTLAREHSDRFILASAGILTILMIILTPISALMLLLQKGFSRLFRNGDKEVSVTEEELMQIIDEIEDEGVLEEQESLLVRSALEFDETTVAEILTPRVDIIAVSLTDNSEKVKKVFMEEGYSRLPVYDKTSDHIVGLISNKEFTRRLLSGEEIEVREIMQEILHIPSLMKLSDALKLMQKEKSHLAVVVDQYGGTEGIVTLEDILEELVGEIWDESDEEVSPVKIINNNVFEIGSELGINDLNRFLESKDIGEIDSESHTAGGWAFEMFGKIPEVGEVTENDEFKLTVLSMEGRRIGRLRVEVISS